MKLVNCTPHYFNIHSNDEILGVSPSGIVPRLKVEREELGMMHGINFTCSKMGDPEGLPESKPDVLFIVSVLVAEHPATKNRIDLVYPGEAIRNEAGQIIGYNGLCVPKHTRDWLMEE